jgi:uncharacterized protein YdaU (DUF1376 family)
LVSYPWYVPDWRNSETRLKLTLEERGFFRELLDHCYVEGSIPTDVKLLAGIAGCSVAQAQRLFPKIREEFDQDGDRLVNPRAVEILEKLQKYHDNRREAGTAGAKKRWRGDRKANGTAMAELKQSYSLPQPLPQPLHQHTPLPPVDAPATDAIPEPVLAALSIPAPTPRARSVFPIPWINCIQNTQNFSSAGPMISAVWILEPKCGYRSSIQARSRPPTLAMFLTV